LTYPLNAQQPDTKLLLDDVKNYFEKVKDYRVKVHISVDVDFLKVPNSDAELLFKQPNKVAINSDGFAMIPKRGLNFTPTELLKGNYAALLEKEETYEGFQCKVIKVVPMDENKDVILATVWIDKLYPVVRKVEATTKSSGTFSLLLKYSPDIIKNYPLPQEMKFIFDITNANLPKGLDGSMNDNTPRKKRNKLTKGSLTINYSDYRINQGIRDEEFRK
jgi:outer membrane lipoprotein-sorting protein